MDVTSNSIAYASLQQLSALAGLDVYVGGELAAVINPNTTNNPNLTLNLPNPNLSAQELSKAGSLLTVRPTLSNYQITYTDVNVNMNQTAPANTPIQLALMSNEWYNNGMLEWGSGNTPPLGARFGVYCPNNQFNDTNYLDEAAYFPVLANGELNFTTADKTIPFSYVDNGKTVNETLNVNVDLSPFYLGTWESLTYPSPITSINETNYDQYIQADDYSEPLILNATAPTLPNNADPRDMIWNGTLLQLNGLNLVHVPFTPTVKDGKITGWTTPTIYAYFTNSMINGIWKCTYPSSWFNINFFISQK